MSAGSSLCRMFSSKVGGTEGSAVCGWVCVCVGGCVCGCVCVGVCVCVEIVLAIGLLTTKKTILSASTFHPDVEYGLMIG